MNDYEKLGVFYLGRSRLVRGRAEAPPKVTEPAQRIIVSNILKR